MTRTTISVSDEVYDRLSEAKREGESWSECLDRLLEGEDPQGSTVNELNALTEDHLEDIEAIVERQVGEAFRNHGTRR